MRVGILTTFTGNDQAYSLVNVVRVQIDLLKQGGYLPVLYASTTLDKWPGVEVRRIAAPDAEADDIYQAMLGQFDDVSVVLCHDIVFLSQHKQWAKALRRFADERDDITWLHWQHSRGDHGTIAPVANSHYCYPNNGDLEHVAKINNTDAEHVHYIPHPLDFDYLGWPELAVRIAEDYQFQFADVSCLLPTRLDRQKQVDKVIRLFAGLKRAGASVCLLIADAYATGDRFIRYKEDCGILIRELGLTSKEVAFLSDEYEQCHYSTPRQVVKALFEMSNLFVQASNAETSSLVVLEAALAGNLCIINADFPPIHHLYESALALPFGSVLENTKYYRHIKDAGGKEIKIEDPQQFWDDEARSTVLHILNAQVSLTLKRQQLRERWPSTVFSEFIEPLIRQVADMNEQPSGDPDVTAIITTLDNLPLLKRQIPVLMIEVGRIIVVNNGSQDGTKEWLDTVGGIEVIHRRNNGAGPGRNAGLALWDNSTEDAYGLPTPYVLMLDGGILPPLGGVAAMRDYLERHEDVDVISPEVASCFTTDESKSSLEIDFIDDDFTFTQRCLSGTAYCLTRAKCWDGMRFNEIGPFSQPGWGVDDNEMSYVWDDADIIHHDFTERAGFMFYRRASGSFARLYKETGVWPNQYGSVYEQRNVWTWQNYPAYHRPLFGWPGAILKSYVFEGVDYPELAKGIKEIHDNNQKKPYEIVVRTDGLSEKTLEWIDTHALRWHWGNTAITPSGDIVRKNGQDVWTGDFLVDTEPRGKLCPVD